MTTSDFLIKWIAYLVALIPVYVLEACVLCHLPVFGVIPMLLPLAAIALAMLEGSAAGAGFGLIVGLLCDAAYPGVSGAWTVGLSLLGALTGYLGQYRLSQNMFSSFLCAFIALVLIDLLRILPRLAGGTPLLPMLQVAVPEILWSVVFIFPIYALFLWVYRRVPKRTVL
ncbi:MAG: rod shape-determining protein MreD [Oscillospiraceae bacterium]|nr:rod shape-determining protein MreD [Oscillospiraceae bacterium]